MEAHEAVCVSREDKVEGRMLAYLAVTDDDDTVKEVVVCRECAEREGLRGE